MSMSTRDWIELRYGEQIDHYVTMLAIFLCVAVVVGTLVSSIIMADPDAARCDCICQTEPIEQAALLACSFFLCGEPVL